MLPPLQIQHELHEGDTVELNQPNASYVFEGTILEMLSDGKVRVQELQEDYVEQSEFTVPVSTVWPSAIPGCFTISVFKHDFQQQIGGEILLSSEIISFFLVSYCPSGHLRPSA